MIRPTDIDGQVERNGRFLAFETKLPGVDLPHGQRIMFEQMVNTGFYTIIIIWGHPGNPQSIELMTRNGNKNYQNTSLTDLRTIVRRWFEWAENQTPAPRFNGDI